MATAIITFKIMPVDPSIDLAAVEGTAKELIAKAGGELGKVEIEPVAFGLNAIKLYVVIDEKLGGDDIETALKGIQGVNSCEIIDFRRALG